MTQQLVNRNAVDMIRAAAVGGIAAEVVLGQLGWSLDFFERCCRRNKIEFATLHVSDLTEPADVILEHALLGLSTEEQFIIASRVAESLGFVLKAKPKVRL